MKLKTCKRCGFKGDVFQVAAHDCVVKNPPAVQQELERLWFIYGNGGPKHNPHDHKFIQRHVEGRGNEAKFYSPTVECRKAVRIALSAT